MTMTVIVEVSRIMSRTFKVALCTVTALVVTVMLTIYIIRMYEMQFAKTPNDFGTFGDYVGGVVGAFTGLLSIVFLYKTYQKQIEIFYEQKHQTELHQFEENFFRLLESFRSILPRLKN